MESAYEVGAAAYQIIGDSAPLLLELGALEVIFCRVLLYSALHSTLGAIIKKH